MCSAMLHTSRALRVVGPEMSRRRNMTEWVLTIKGNDAWFLKHDVNSLSDVHGTHARVMFSPFYFLP